NTQYIIDCTGNRAATFIRYFIMDGIHPDYGIDRIKYTGFPCFYFRKYTICNGTDCVGRDTVTEILFHPVANLTCTVSHSIQTNYTVCNTLCQDSFTLLDELWIKT